MEDSDEEINVPKERVPKVEPESTRPEFHPIRPPIQRLQNGIVSIISRYKYEPLEGDQIRVIKLYPRESNAQENVVCKIFHKSLSNVKGKYHALSYHWGVTPGEPARYRIDVMPHKNAIANAVRHMQSTNIRPTSASKTEDKKLHLNVHANLFTALKELRPNKGEDPIWLWIDYICIKQHGDWAEDEKSKQVPRMAEIYNTAVGVIIWLGQGMDTTNTAMDFINEVIHLKKLHEEVLSDPASLGKWNAFTDLLRFHWFSRRWVVQEVALARQATLRCGAKEVRWENFVTAVSLFTKHLEKIKKLYRGPEVEGNARHLQDVEGLGAIVLVNCLNDLARKSTNGDIKERLVPIESLVSQLLFFAVSRPHDAIYSLMTLARDTYVDTTKAQPRRAQFEIKVDYQQDPVQLFTHFIAGCIRTSKSLDIICRHWAPNVEDGDYPSWILRISDSTFGSPETALRGRRSGNSFVGASFRPMTKTYMACGPFTAGEEVQVISANGEGKPVSQKEFPGGNVVPLPPQEYKYCLTVQGIRIGIITKVFPRVVGSTVPKEWLEALGLIMDKKAGASYPPVLWRTLVADRDEHGKSVDAWYSQAFDQCLNEVAVTDVNGDFHTNVEMAQSRKPLAEDMLHFLSRVRSIVTNRSMFRAKSLCADCSSQIPADKREHRSLRCPNKKRKVPPTGTTRANTERDASPESDSAGDDQKVEPMYGLGPGTALQKFKPRDTWLVCILKGCSVPVILRKLSSGVYCLVGEAFVYGKMDAEAMEGLEERMEKGELVFDDFILV